MGQKVPPLSWRDQSMPSKGKMLAENSDDRKKAKAAVKRKPGDTGKRLVRKQPPDRETNEIIGLDPTFQLKVASKPGGAQGTYSLLEWNGAEISFGVRRLSDYDTNEIDITVDLVLLVLSGNSKILQMI